ncbi:MAG: DUF2061 domain-containing protein [Candidatus Hermodarchaeota archaeon]
MKLERIEWKQSVIKTLIYRAITLVLGTLTVYFLTGSIALATGAAILTESVQAVNYFIYELVWSNISRKKLEKEILERIKRREINLKINFEPIREISYELSQIDTFVPKLYLSVLHFFDSMLKNEELQEIHEELQMHKNNFKRVHSSRKLFFLDNKK